MLRQRAQSPGGVPGAFSLVHHRGGRRLVIALVYDPSAVSIPRVQSRLRGADLLLFPELMDGGYAALTGGARPHTPASPLIRRLRLLSRDLVPVCVAGSLFYRAGTRRPTNSSLVFIRGRLRARYDKVHLFRPARDPRYFQRGRRLCLFPVPGEHRLVAGLMICFDLRFPELARALTVRGAHMLLVPARWPAERDDAWRTLLKARAIENQCFVVGCNARGAEGGRSYAFDPLGREIFASRRTGGPAADLIVLETDMLSTARSLYRSTHEARLSISQRGLFRINASRRRSGRHK